MENDNKKLRLIRVAKEFKVGVTTLTDFLNKKGISVDNSPNTLISPEAYALAEKEFGTNRSSTSARDSVREKIASKQETVSIEEPKQAPKRTIEVKDEIAQQPRILGRVELDKKGIKIYATAGTCKYLNEFVHFLVALRLDRLCKECVLYYYELNFSFEASLAESVCLFSVETCDISYIEVWSRIELC